MVRPDQQLSWHKTMWDNKIVFGVIDPPYVFSEDLLQWSPKQLKTKKKGRKSSMHIGKGSMHIGKGSIHIRKDYKLLKLRMGLILNKDSSSTKHGLDMSFKNNMQQNLAKLKLKARSNVPSSLI